MIRSSHTIDIIVLGGGPAGAAAARLLATWGHDVVLLPGRAGAAHARAESLPPSCRAPFMHLGLLAEIDEAAFLPTYGNTTAWDAPDLERSGFGGSAGYQVERWKLDRLLRTGAEHAGARLIAQGVADSVVRGSEGVWRVGWRSPSGRGTAEARWLLDCTGRAGVLARQGLRVPYEGPATVSIGAEWEVAAGGNEGDVGDTMVEAFRGGWSWSVPIDRTRRYVAVMVDPVVTPLAGRPLTETYLLELAFTRHTAALLAAGRRLGSPSACSATPYHATRYTGDGFLLVGDAGSFIDPLSSFGVKKALASGWLAAVAVHTSLIDPARESAALELHDEREAMVKQRYSDQARTHYGRAAELHRTPFWQRRVQNGARTGGDPDFREEGLLGEGAAGRVPGAPDAAGLARAFHSIRSASTLALRPSAGLKRVGRPTVRGREVVVLDHLFVPGMEAPLRYLGAIELPRLVDLTQRHHDVPELFADYRRGSPEAALPEVLRALSTLLALGVLEPVDASAS